MRLKLEPQVPLFLTPSSGIVPEYSSADIAFHFSMHIPDLSMNIMSFWESILQSIRMQAGFHM